jgi:hypothetical protein
MALKEQPKLTFITLHTKLEEMPQHSSDSPVMPKKARWRLVIGFSAAALGLLAGKLLPSNHIITVVIAATFLVVELVALGLAMVSQLPRTWPTFSGERCEAAEEMDFDLPHHQKLIHWLRDHPREQLEELSSYTSYRLERLRERLPLLTGSIEKIGALPIFIALYIQFKDAHWPPHPSWLEIVLIFALMFGYWISLLQINVRFRLQTYDMLLKKAKTIDSWDRRSDENGV